MKNKINFKQRKLLRVEVIGSNSNSQNICKKKKGNRLYSEWLFAGNTNNKKTLQGGGGSNF